jgi:hypothetical protein
MPATDYRSVLEQIIVRHGLDEKRPYWASVQRLIERRKLSHATCKALLTAAERAVQELEDYPDHLHRTPTAEQLYAGGEPQVRLGTLLSDESLVVGIRFDRPLHIVVAGTTGFGKTTIIRAMLKAIHEFNRCHPNDLSR